MEWPVLLQNTAQPHARYTILEYHTVQPQVTLRQQATPVLIQRALQFIPNVLPTSAYFVTPDAEHAQIT